MCSRRKTNFRYTSRAQKTKSQLRGIHNHILQRDS
jgi:hypothetical protein